MFQSHHPLRTFAWRKLVSMLCMSSPLPLCPLMQTPSLTITMRSHPPAEQPPQPSPPALTLLCLQLMPSAHSWMVELDCMTLGGGGGISWERRYSLRHFSFVAILISVVHCGIVFQGHIETIFDCKFKPDDCDQFATGSFDGTIKIWDINNFETVSLSPGCHTFHFPP